MPQAADSIFFANFLQLSAISAWCSYCHASYKQAGTTLYHCWIGVLRRVRAATGSYLPVVCVRHVLGGSLGRIGTILAVRVCVLVPCILRAGPHLSVHVAAPAGVEQKEGHTGFFSSTHLLRCLPLFVSRDGFSYPFPSLACETTSR